MFESDWSERVGSFSITVGWTAAATLIEGRVEWTPDINTFIAGVSSFDLKS